MMSRCQGRAVHRRHLERYSDLGSLQLPWDTLSLASKGYTLTARAYDAAENVGEAVSKVTVVEPLTINTGTLTDATVGTSSSQALAATGGIKPYNWTLAAGSLPPGMTLAASTGYISGTPTTAGTYSFTAQVTDSQAPSVTATKAFTLTVVIGPLTITTTTLTNATVGTATSKAWPRRAASSRTTGRWRPAACRRG